MPYGIEALALYRNAEIADKEATTFDDAVAVGQAAVDAGKVESALNLPVGELGDAYHMEPILTSFGGYIFAYDDADRVRPRGRRHRQGGLARGRPTRSPQLAKQNVLRTSISGDNSIALFTAGKAAFLVSGPWALADVQKAGFNYGIQPVPGFEGEEPAAAVHGCAGVHGGRARRRTRPSPRSS